MRSERVRGTQRSGRLRLSSSVVGLIVASLGLLVVTVVLLRESPESILQSAVECLDEGRLEEAEALALRVLKKQPESATALEIAGTAALRAEQYATAVDYFERLLRVDTPDPGVLAACGKCQFELGRATDAEKSFRQALELDPENVTVQEHLFLLLEFQGRTWDAKPLVTQLIRRGQLTDSVLFLSTSIEELAEDTIGFTERCMAAVPDDPVPRLRLARVAIDENRFDEAEPILREIVGQRPDLVEAQAWLGVTLAYLEADEKLVAWNHQLPTESDEHPQTWFARGLWSERQASDEAAARCFWEAVRRDPDHGGSVSHLCRMLEALQRTVDAEQLAVRARHLAQLEVAVSEAKGFRKLGVDKRIPLTLEKLGRFEQAAAWFQLALRATPDARWAGVGLTRVGRRLDQHFGQQVVLPEELAELDLSGLPLPVWPQQRDPASTPQSDAGDSSGMQFIDAAADAGLEFTFQSDASPEDRMEFLFKFDGGGVAILDFDGDDAPDVYLTQGSPWPPGAGSAPLPVNRLFRNSDGQSFMDTTTSARLTGSDYSQGVTVGDYDNDGFPDLYIGNVKGNRFLRNMGDGTFEDVTEETQTAGIEWTSSCVLADLNSDGLPDLYTVSYLGGNALDGCDTAVWDKCAPTLFPAAQDQLYVNRGDGTFENVTAGSGIVAPDGRGLGVVAADFDNSGRLSLFVANDMSANFFFANESGPGGSLTFSERGLISGLALGTNGRAQASMGVAAGDVNGDTGIDLFVTNFSDENNTLYLSGGLGLYTDGTQSARLARPGFSMLGFGTQFLDADLDGDLDLVIANGHVFPFSEDVPEPRMRPQLHENIGGRFREVDPKVAGPYFEQKHLGRSLARVDWNRDRRDDFIVSHLDTPVALLTNAGQSGHSVSFRLIGTSTARDAIGASVTVNSDGRSQTRQLTAGDGYQCSNERRLVFGIGTSNQEPPQIDEVTVRWASGIEQRFTGLVPGADYVLVEGRSVETVRVARPDE